MSFLSTERRTLDKYLPGLDEELASIALQEQERPGNPALPLFKQRCGTSLLIPEAQGGLGATAVEAVQVHRALGSRSPSLAVAAVMHNFSIATMAAFAVFDDQSEGGDILAAVASEKMWIASGFAEGKSGQHILDSTVLVERKNSHWQVNGRKMPCSLSRSMNLLTAAVTVRSPGEAPRRAVALIPSDSEGIRREPFWSSLVLKGAESDQIVLENVLIPEGFLFFPEGQSELDDVETAGYVWFQVLVAASYLGICSGLAEKVVCKPRISAVELSRLASELEGAMAGLEAVAQAIDKEGPNEHLLAKALFMRYHVQEVIMRCAPAAAEWLGGMEFVTSEESSYRLAACRALAFHPPSRNASAQSLADYLAGAKMTSV